MCCSPRLGRLAGVSLEDPAAELSPLRGMEDILVMGLNLIDRGKSRGGVQNCSKYSARKKDKKCARVKSGKAAAGVGKGEQGSLVGVKD